MAWSTTKLREMAPFPGLRVHHFRHSAQVQRRADELPLGLGLGQSAHAELAEPEHALYPGVWRLRYANRQTGNYSSDDEGGTQDSRSKSHHHNTSR